METTGNRRLLRDLAAVGLVLEDRLPARQRIESQLGEVLTRTVYATLSLNPPVAPTSVGRSRRAA